MQIKDSLALDASGLSRTSDRYLVGMAKVARAGNVQRYLGSEIGLTGDDADKMFGVYRDPDVVFDETAMQSLAGKPVTRGHPPEGVNAGTWDDFAVGHMGGRIVRDGEHVVASMAIMDENAAEEVERGARSLSAGYTVEIVKDEGVSPEGEPYQYRQTGSLRFNHVAYLPNNNPRAGNTRIGDGAGHWGAAPINGNSARSADMADNAIKTRTVLVDGLSVECTDAGAQAIEKLQKQITDAESGHQTAIAAKDKEIGEKDAEIDKLKGQVLDAAALDKRVAERSSLIDGARKVTKDVKTEGQSDADIRRSVVAAKLGDAAVEGRSDEYIAARFDGLVEAAATDSANDPLKAPIKQTARDGDPWSAGVFDSAGVKMKKEA